MNLFVFGLGYSALAFVTRHGASFAHVTGTVRSSDKAQRLAQKLGTAGGFVPLVFDGSKAGADVLLALAQADVMLVSVPPGEHGDAALQALAQSDIATPALKRIVYLSTIGVYGDHQGGWIDEDSPSRPSAGRSHARLAAEEGWAQFAKARQIPLDILRLAGIYGPGRNQLAALRSGTAKRIIKPGQVFNRIHVDDIAAAVHACSVTQKPGAIYNVTDDEPAPPQEVVAFAAELLGVSPPPEQDFDTAELTPMARSFYGENKRVKNARIKRELGFSFQYPTYREGLRALLASGEGS
jgi:nucleoside-diphosphate-sugar epimerase